MTGEGFSDSKGPSMRLLCYSFLTIGLLAAISQLFLLGPQLPLQVASHFDVYGIANGWMSRTDFLVSYAILQLTLAAAVVATALAMRYLPTALLNLPNKEYWLETERRDNTIQVLSNLFILIAGWTTFLMVGLFQLTYLSNMVNANAIPVGTCMTLLAIYFVCQLAIVGVCYIKFLNIPSQRTSKSLAGQA